MTNIPDPRLIPQTSMPIMIDCNQTDFDGNVIDFRTDIKGIHPFCHSMIAIDQGQFVTQWPNGYFEIPMAKYMTPNTYLQFTTLVNSNPAFVEAFRTSVLAKLNGPWWRKAYNWVQILGQAVGLPWLSFPGLDDCTMDVIFHLKSVSIHLPMPDNEIIQVIPNNCNPEQFADIKMQNPSVFNILGAYDSSIGTIVP
jgi:hypothetical protein